jgi:ATP-dependent exoDNAse (exonuclease V) beta subunit
MKTDISSTSISEVAAYQFCGEFHRLKFVQKWDDLVVEQWPVPLEWSKKLKAAKRGLVKEDPERERVGLLLRKLEIQRKERGIALHRVLERIKGSDFDSSVAKLWLEEAYFAQGAVDRKDVLDELLALDLQVLGRFLNSEIGKKLFSPSVVAFPEIPFVWDFAGIKIHGAMDRLVKHAENHWTVVDYKSSILEESRERYKFQIAAYKAAIEIKLKQEGIENPVVEAYLVSLLSSDVIPVNGYSAETEKQLAAEIIHLRENYAITETGRNSRSRGITEKDACFSCPYVLHCDVGREFVLR